MELQSAYPVSACVIRPIRLCDGVLIGADRRRQNIGSCRARDLTYLALSPIVD
jgi:hypothetical protein